jgi:phosphatidylserine decarboxylase
MMERLFATYLARSASRIMGRVATTPLPGGVLRPLIGAYALGLGVSMDEIEEPSGGFRSFGEFFGRRLRTGARPVCAEDGALVSPCDGEILSFGDITETAGCSFAIKGSRYDIGALLGSPEAAPVFGGGGYLVVYLHPRDYHRVHMPADGVLLRVRHIPGTLYPVNGWLDGRVDEILGKNERMVFHIELPAGGELALVMVAAFGVGNIDTRFSPGPRLRHDVSRERDFEPPVPLDRGAEIGAFMLGSTVVLLWTEGAFELVPGLVRCATAMGRKLGQVGGPAEERGMLFGSENGR